MTTKYIENMLLLGWSKFQVLRSNLGAFDIFTFPPLNANWTFRWEGGKALGVSAGNFWTKADWCIFIQCGALNYQQIVHFTLWLFKLYQAKSPINFYNTKNYGWFADNVNMFVRTQLECFLITYFRCQRSFLKKYIVLIPLTSPRKCMSVFVLECSDIWGSKISSGR